MSGFVNFAIPTTKLADGRDFISDQTAAEYPVVREFVERFPNFWVRDDMYCGWSSPLPEPEHRRPTPDDTNGD